MGNPKKPAWELIWEIIRKNYDDDDYYQVNRLYKLLDEAKAFVERCFGCGHFYYDKYVGLELDAFGRECQWAKDWIRKEHAETTALSIDAKTSYLKEWTDYIDKIYQWIQSAFHNGKADDFEYERLRNLRDGLFHHIALFYDAEISHKKDEIKRLQNQQKNKPQGKGGRAQKPKRTKRKRKAPPEFLKEARERNAVKELTKNPNITCVKLAEILECHKSTVVRLKAWINREVLSSELPKGILTRQEDDSYTVDGIARTEPEDQ